MGLSMLNDLTVWKDERGRVFDPYSPLNGRHGRVKTRYFMVEGQGHFPADMLRYDQAWAITGLGVPDDPLQPRRIVVLATRQPVGKLQAPTKGRWESFCWNVVQRRVPFEDVRILVMGGDGTWTGNCQRCGERALASAPSYFNGQTICLDCMTAERQHPDFNEARNQAMRAVKRKDKTFLGIGWRGEQTA